MPEQAPPPSDDPAIDPQQQPAGKASLLGRLKVFAFVLVVIVVECLVAYLWLPDAGQTAAMASAALQDGAPDDPLLAAAAAEEEEEPVADQLEVDLGEFSVTAFQPISNTTLRIDFHLFGTVGVEDEAVFHTLMEENLHRFREQVIVTLRSAELNDLTDAGLGLVKRKILEKTNRALGKPLLQTVIFSEFSFVEQ